MWCSPAAGATYTIVDKNGASIAGVSPSSSVTASTAIHLPSATYQPVPVTR
ncbi:hypothetical protein [Ferruginibacter paludis]|uniref:hypothetical protein n=1 Tax=Ferruginibacter paludis TaxID=1310417 RepID=UPI0025B54E55|nr:hypothetical protein [Ferruginibacter paludis]